MSDMNEKELDELEEEEEIENYITLTDDDGNEVSFEMIGTVEYEEHIYAVLLPFDDEDDEVVILEVIPGETPEEDDFVSVNDDEPNLLTTVQGGGHLQHQLLKGRARIDHHAFLFIPTRQDATLGICRIVASMDADAAESRHVHQQGQPTLEAIRLRNHDTVAALGYRRPSGHLLFLLQVTALGLQRIAQITLGFRY